MPSASEIARQEAENIREDVERLEDDTRFGVDKDAPLTITIERGDVVARIRLDGLLIGYTRDPEALVAATISPAIKQIMEMTNG